VFFAVVFYPAIIANKEHGNKVHEANIFGGISVN
jgi:hypothetical protein